MGGALGSMARHGVNHLVHTRWLTTRFPAGTVAVNLVGCFLIGVPAGLVASDRIALRLHWREFVFVGLLGGFTTFSTFGLDTFLLGRTHSMAQAIGERDAAGGRRAAGRLGRLPPRRKSRLRMSGHGEDARTRGRRQGPADQVPADGAQPCPLNPTC